MSIVTPVATNGNVVDDPPVLTSPRSALSALGTFLRSRNYCQHATESVLAYVDEFGTLEACDSLDPEDVAMAEQIYVNTLPAEPMTSHDWDCPDRWELGPVASPDTDLAPDLDRFEPDPADRQWWAEFSTNNGHSIAGSPPAHHEPTDRDWDEMARWSEDVFGPPRRSHHRRRRHRRNRLLRLIHLLSDAIHGQGGPWACLWATHAGEPPVASSQSF